MIDRDKKALQYYLYDRRGHQQARVEKSRNYRAEIMRLARVLDRGGKCVK